MSEPWVLIETSRRGGWVALCQPPAGGGESEARILQVVLDPARRHNRDLAPAIQDLLHQAGLSARQVRGVMISIGPGSYTGLRVGVMTAKTLAWATNRPLVAIPTFPIIAEQTPMSARRVDVIADALQGAIYRQRFYRGSQHWEPEDNLQIEPASAWCEALTREAGARDAVWVSGPAVEQYDSSIPKMIPRVAPEQRLPGVQAMLAVGLRLSALTRTELLRLEPLYLRGSSAEEKAARKAAASAPQSA